MDLLVVICFQISIFERLETTSCGTSCYVSWLWFAFKLVSLSDWKQRDLENQLNKLVVICFQISIFERLETTKEALEQLKQLLWFAFKLVSLSDWKQLYLEKDGVKVVVICFQISIFERLETTSLHIFQNISRLWFAFKLVSLSDWKQPLFFVLTMQRCCDLLSN